MKTAVIQMNAGVNKKKNVDKAFDFVQKAIRKKAKFILLPEVFSYRGPLKSQKDHQEIAEKISGPTLSRFRKVAKDNKVCILAGSIYEQSPKPKKVFNTSVLISSSGGVVAKYRKIHMFDAIIDRKRICESDLFLAGNKKVSAKAFGFEVGLSVCYDLRFPELYRHYAMKRADILCVPSAFTEETGKKHWHALLRARAIENLSYVLAPNQCGRGINGIRNYGHSLIVDPWGKVLAEASGNKEEIIYADIVKSELTKYRKKLPKIRKC